MAAARPSLGSIRPEALRGRLGATHYDGRYCLTKEPYLVEGAKALGDFGFGVAKFWFNPRGLAGYGFHSDWKVSRDATLVELARHPYYRQVFGMPFSVIVLEVTTLGRHGNRVWLEDGEHLREVGRQVHDLARYLLETHRDREVVFVLQNWEGDWMSREGARDDKAWPADDAERRFAGMRNWFEVRQAAVERARREVPASKARVLHAIEVNKVLESLDGVPTLTTEVLPRVAVDLVSWSCYDGTRDVVSAWHGVEIIRHFARTRADGRKPAVYIGEIGNPENAGKQSEASVRQWWDERLGVFLALGVPWIIHWELYCNEPKDGNKGDRRARTAEEMRGFWLLRPDGSDSWSGRYLRELLQRRSTEAAAEP